MPPSQKITGFFLALFALSQLSCSSPPLIPELLIIPTSIQVGTKQAGEFSLRPNNVFLSSETLVFKMDISGLTLKHGTVHVTVDVLLSKDKLVIGSQNNIWGEDGLVKEVPGSVVTQTMPTGTASLELALGLPATSEGQILANITLKDLNNQSKMTQFSVPLIINLQK